MTEKGPGRKLGGGGGENVVKRQETGETEKPG